MIIEIKGVQFVNKGAELMLYAVLQELENQDVEFVLAPNTSSSFLARAKVGAYQKALLRKRTTDMNFLSYYIPKSIRNWFKSSWGIVFEADIDVIIDASGFSYGEQWPSTATINAGNEIERFKRKNKKYIFLPQALGPFDDKMKSVVDKKISKADLICARDSSSYKSLTDIVGEKGNIFQYPDFTNLVEGSNLNKYQHLSNSILIIPNNNMISGRNDKSSWKETYIDFLVASTEIVKKLGFEPVILNHEGIEDREICELVLDKLDFRVEMIEILDPREVKAAIGSSKAIICSRFHGCVSALTQSIPCLGTSWSHKYEKLFDEYHRANFLIRSDYIPEELEEILKESISTVDNRDYQESIKYFKVRSEEMWNKVFSILGIVRK